MEKLRLAVAAVAGIASASAFFMGVTVVNVIANAGLLVQFLLASGAVGFGYVVLRKQE